MRDVAEQLARLFPEVRAKFGSCTRKVAYDSIEQALAVKERRERTPGVRLEIYPCDYAPADAPHWHLTRQAPSEAQLMRRMAELQTAAATMKVGLLALRERQHAPRQQERQLIQDLHRRGRTSLRWPSLRQLREVYEAQRDDLTRLDAVWDEGITVHHHLDELLITGQTIFADESPRTLDGYRELLARLAEAQVWADEHREEKDVWIGATMAASDDW
jgi:hypothetical protein